MPATFTFCRYLPKWSYFVWGDGMSVEGGGGREGREVAWPDRQCREGSHQQPQSDTALWLHQSGNINLDSWGGNECERNRSDRLELIFPKRTWRWCVTFQPVSDKHNLHTSEAFAPPSHAPVSRPATWSALWVRSPIQRVEKGNMSSNSPNPVLRHKEILTFLHLEALSVFKKSCTIKNRFSDYFFLDSFEIYTFNTKQHFKTK